MNLQFVPSGNLNFAMKPQVQKRAGKQIMQLSQDGCTHFLLFSTPLNYKTDLNDPSIQAAVLSIGEALLRAKNLHLPGHEQISVTCWNYFDYRKSQFLELPDRAANYAVCGCCLEQKTNTLNLLLPFPSVSYQASVAVELSYKVAPYCKVTRGLFGRTKSEPTPFYQVNFPKTAAYSDGCIFYTIGKDPIRYPVTEQMMGRAVLIRTDGEIPQFESAADGITLKKL